MNLLFFMKGIILQLLKSIVVLLEVEVMSPPPPPTESDFQQAKLNFETHYFSKNPSLWRSVFGYARKIYISVLSNNRVKLKFWNRNYLLFKSFGTEISFQKRVSFLWISGWQKSYATKVALGINRKKVT